MAGMFDYSPFFGPMPPGGGMNEGLSHVSNALDRLAQRRQQYQMHRERLEAEMREREMMERGLMARTEAENAARAEAAQQKAEWDAKLDMEKRAQDSQKDLFDIMAAGDIERARALAQGRMMTMAPHARERVATPAEQPITGDQADDMMNAIDWFQQSKGIDAQNEQIARRDQEDPIFRFTTPLGSSFDYRRGAKREADLEAGRRLADELEASLRGIPMTPYLKQAVGEELPKVRGGAYAGGKEDPNKVIRERMQHLEDEANRNRRAAAVGTRPPKLPTPTQVTDDARSDMNAYLTNTGYKIDQASMRQFDRMLNQADLAAQGNPSAARTFMGMFTKFAQGEVGVLNQNDIEVFWNQAGSPLDRTEEALTKLLSGGLGENKRRQAVAAIQGLKATVRQRIDGAYRGAAEYMRKYGAEGERYVKAYFGKGFPENETKGGPAAALARVKALKKKKGSGR